MKIKYHASLLTIIPVLVLSAQFSGFAQGTAFTYQGRLNDGANPANGTYDLRFIAYDGSAGGSEQGPIITSNGILVSNGLFTTTLDFGGIFFGGARWLEISVRTNGGSSFTILSPRQPLAPAPYAITAENVVAGAGLAGTYGSAVTFNNVGNSFNGNGAGLANVNASTLSGLASSNFWQMGGNNVAAGKFLGSSNNQPVEIWANNRRVMQFAYASNELHGFSPNLIGGFAGNFVADGVVGATIVGGGSSGTASNRVLGDFGTVVGGSRNTAQGVDSTAMGSGSTASGDSSTAMGNSSTASGNGATAMGVLSVASGDYSTATGDSTASDLFSTAMGAAHATNSYATAMGGAIAGGQSSTAAGGSFATADFSVALGASEAAGRYATALGYGLADGDYSSALGNSVAHGTNATAMGRSLAGANYATALGQSTAEVGDYSTAMGFSDASGTAATALGRSSAGGNSATAVGESVANGAFSFSGGYNAYVGHDGSFVWADNSASIVFHSTATNQFLIRAAGGVGIGTAAPETPLHIADYHGITLGASATSGGNTALRIDLSAVQNGYAELQAISQAGSSFGNLILQASGGKVGIGKNNPATALDVNGTCSATTFNTTSDRNLKEHFTSVNGREVLDEVLALPLSRWDFKNDPATRHIGPMAQDFYAAFRVGTDDKHIATVDEGGVALAAIKGLNEKVDSENAALRAENAELKQKAARLDELEQRLSALEQQLAQ
jgi:trimeric autotransporter adhesin